jgi:hypothetical protein
MGQLGTRVSSQSLAPSAWAMRFPRITNHAAGTLSQTTLLVLSLVLSLASRPIPTTLDDVLKHVSESGFDCAEHQQLAGQASI